MQRRPKLLLLTGIPGTGKTDAGRHLARAHGFVHLDAEAFIISRNVQNRAEWEAAWAEFRSQAEGHHLAGKDVVITWGFIPGQDDPVVRALQAMGFTMVWFDGDRAAARREFLRRGNVSAELLDLQLARIAALDIDSFAPIQLNPFDERGEFLPRAIIAERLRALA